MKRDSDFKTITKLEAVRDQLETAIKLFFQDESFVAVHTLCSAAFNVLKDISKKNNGDFAFEMEVRIKPEFLRDWYGATNRPSNFFKHANTDPDPNGVLEFNEKVNDLKLMMCCWGYKELAGIRTPIMEAYVKWMLAFYPHLFKLDEEASIAIESAHKTFNGGIWDRNQKKLAGRILLNKDSNRQ